MEAEKKVRVIIWGGWGFNGKSQQVSSALKAAYNLTDEQMSIERGPGKSIKVEFINGDQTTTIMEKEGPGFFTSETPNAIVEDLRSYF